MRPEGLPPGRAGAGPDAVVTYRVAVAPTKFAVGVEAPGYRDHTYDWRSQTDNSRGVRATFKLAPLAAALERTYTTDAHLVSYYIVDRVGRVLPEQPRVNKGGLSWLLEQGYAVEHELLFCDVDNPLHGEWDDRQRAAFDELWATAAPLQTTGVYLTRHGYRLIQPLDEPVSASEAERYLASWLDELSDHGITPDTACVDWTRLFRLPHVRRGPVAYRSPFVDLSRLSPRRIVPKDLPGPRRGLDAGGYAA